MGSKRPHSLVLFALLTAALVVVLTNCFGGEEEGSRTTRRVASTTESSRLSPSMVTGGVFNGLDAEALSTFQSKDPFVQQAVPPNTTTTAAPSPATSTTVFLTTTTTYFRTTTTRSATTTTAHGTTTTAAPTTTTSPYRHTLKILSITTVSGAPAVTLQVDNTIYQNKRVGNVMSTSWGQVKILDLSTVSKVVTLRHGSETLVLTVGQRIYE